MAIDAWQYFFYWNRSRIHHSPSHISPLRLRYEIYLLLLLSNYNGIYQRHLKWWMGGGRHRYASERGSHVLIHGRKETLCDLMMCWVLRDYDVTWARPWCLNSNFRQHDCLFNSLFMTETKKLIKKNSAWGGSIGYKLIPLTNKAESASMT